MASAPRPVGAGVVGSWRRCCGRSQQPRPGCGPSRAGRPATPPPDPVVAPEQQGWTELEEGDFLLPWLLHITMYELCECPCCAPFRDPKPGG
jgi:hypothetical protein